MRHDKTAREEAGGVKSDIDTGGFHIVTGGVIQRGDLIWVHERRDIKFNDGRPERVVSVERQQPDSRD